MKKKDFFLKIIAGLVGLVIFFELYMLLSSVFFASYYFLLGKTLFDIPGFALGLLNILVCIAGFYAGIKLYNNKGTYYKVFSPTKQNMLATFVLSLFLVVSSSLLWGVMVFPLVGIYGSELAMLPSLLVVSVLNAILFFPFSAIAFYIYKNFKTPEFKNVRTKLAVLLILLNPLFLWLGFGFFGQYTLAITYEPCGLKIVGFTENSTARDAGVAVGEIIVGIDNHEIKTFDDLTEYTVSVTSKRVVKLRTINNEYNVTVDPQLEEHLLGVKVRTDLCSKDMPLSRLP